MEAGEALPAELTLKFSLIMQEPSAGVQASPSMVKDYMQIIFKFQGLFMTQIILTVKAEWFSPTKEQLELTGKVLNLFYPALEVPALLIM